MVFLEIEPGIWVVPDMVTSVQGCHDGQGGHYVEIHVLGGDIVRCSEHMGPTFYAPETRLGLPCYAAIEPIDFHAFGNETALKLAADHARNIQGWIAEHRVSPIELRPLP